MSVKEEYENLATKSREDLEKEIHRLRIMIGLNKKKYIPFDEAWGVFLRRIMRMNTGYGSE